MTATKYYGTPTCSRCGWRGPVKPHRLEWEAQDYAAAGRDRHVATACPMRGTT
jgi:hypothetical protein